MNKITPSLLRAAARLTLAASVGLMACDRQALESEPQNPYAVTLAQAQQIAEHLTNTNVAAPAATLKTISSHFVLNAGQHPAMYVFNYKEGGFSVIAADRHLLPVLAYSTSSGYATTNKPGGLLFWERKMEQTVAAMQAASTPAPDDIVRREWVAALNPATLNRHPLSTATSKLAPDPEPTPPFTQAIIGPYLPVTWGQGCSYNNLFPAGAICGETPTGCVMTAMAQVMAYYRYPATYNWAAMPTNQGNGEVQRLMRDISLSLNNVSYGPTSTGAYPDEAAGGPNNNQGFRNYRFGYGNSSFQSYNYTSVVNELQTSRPAILTGCDNAYGCHMWVADGLETDCYNFEGGGGVCYQYLHMNWGWHEQGTTTGGGSGGDFSGWFQYNDWTIRGAGANGGNINFQNANGMIVNIHP